MSNVNHNVCVVTGATRGIGRGIALGLAEPGATIYITGRTMKPGTGSSVGGSLEETAAEITAKGGKAISVVVDHSKEDEVKALFEQVDREQNGRLDVLVNNVYAAVTFLVEMNGKTFYEIDSHSPGEAWDRVNNVGLRNQYICSTLATRLMLRHSEKNPESKHPGLIVNISSMGGKHYMFGVAYGTGKAALDRMTSDMSIELNKRKANISVISLWPGPVRTEELLSAKKSNKNVDDIPIQPDLSESTELVGLAVAALRREPQEKVMSRSGQITLVSDITREYKIRELDGTIPPDFRSLPTLMRLLRLRGANLVPGFIRVSMAEFLEKMAEK